MHEKKDIWKTDGIAMGRAMVLSGCDRVGETPHIDSGFKGGDISFIRAETSSEKNQSPLDGQTLFQRIAAISGLWIHRWGWIHHLQR